MITLCDEKISHHFSNSFTTQRSIAIYDTTLRDGEQAPGFSMYADAKILLAQQLMATGVDVIEAGFPMTSPSDFAAVRTIAQLADDTCISALARAKKTDIDCAWEAVSAAQNPRLHIFLPASDIQIQYQLGKNRSYVLHEACQAIDYARRYTENVQFSAMDATRADQHFLAMLYQEAILTGAQVINISDTVGYFLPQEMTALVHFLQDAVLSIDTVQLSVHCHNDLGLAVANSLAAIQAGAQQVECTLNGIGERAGNATFEKIINALFICQEEFTVSTQINYYELLKAIQLLPKLYCVESKKECQIPN